MKTGILFPILASLTLAAGCGTVASSTARTAATSGAGEPGRLLTECTNAKTKPSFRVRDNSLLGRRAGFLDPTVGYLTSALSSSKEAFSCLNAQDATGGVVTECSRA